MYIETIRIQDGRVRNIGYHNARCNATRAAIYGCSGVLNLRSYIQCPIELATGTTKCRITFAEQIKKIEYEPYQMRPISSLKVLESNRVEYSHKSIQRDDLSDLYSKRSDCDDIIMVKEGLLTDTYYGNIALLKSGQWYTPKTPLLAGTMRAYLLDKGRVKTKDINISEIKQYDKLTIFNAMIPFGNIQVSIDNIY